MQVLVEEQTLNIAQSGNVTFVRIITQEKTNLTVISKIVQVDQVMFTILIHEI